MHSPPEDGPREHDFPAHIQEAHFDAETTGRVRPYLSFIIIFQSRITAAYVLGLQPGACGENSFPKSRLPRYKTWSPDLGDGNL